MTAARLAGTLLFLCALLPARVLSHSTQHGDPSPWTSWNFEPSIVIPLLLVSAIYIVGMLRVWQRAGTGRGISRAAASCWHAGVAALVVALLSPLEAYTAALFSVHMVQHLLLILVAAPLLVLGAPDVALLWALPKHWRSGWGRFERTLARWFSGESGGGKGPLILALLATGVLWAWHLPQLYDLAVQNEAVHYAEHAAFLVTALLFWASILRLRPRDHAGNGLRILYVFGMAMQGSLLGALITFAARPLYASHLQSAERFGLAPLVDQQIAGLIMWVPPAGLYIAISSYLFVKWMGAVSARNATPKNKHPKPVND